LVAEGREDRSPPKPKGMRWRTYKAICEKLDAAAHELDLDLLRVVERLERLAAR
jgi:hypothetical protein